MLQMSLPPAPVLNIILEQSRARVAAQLEGQLLCSFIHPSSCLNSPSHCSPGPVLDLVCFITIAYAPVGTRSQIAGTPRVFLTAWLHIHPLPCLLIL